MKHLALLVLVAAASDLFAQAPEVPASRQLALCVSKSQANGGTRLEIHAGPVTRTSNVRIVGQTSGGRAIDTSGVLRRSGVNEIISFDNARLTMLARGRAEPWAPRFEGVLVYQLGPAGSLAPLRREALTCYTHDGTPAEEALTRRMSVLAALIEREIGTAACTQDVQCKAIGFGSKPCGGFWSYKIYSTADSNPARLERLVKSHNDLEAELNLLTQRFSDCRFLEAPQELRCRNQRCVADS